MNLDIFVLDALDQVSSGMQWFNDSDECYRCNVLMTAMRAIGAQ